MDEFWAGEPKRGSMAGMEADFVRRLAQLLLWIAIPCAAQSWAPSKADRSHLSFQLRQCSRQDIEQYRPPFQRPQSCYLVVVTNRAMHKIHWSAPEPYLPPIHLFAEDGHEVEQRIFRMSTRVREFDIPAGRSWTIAKDVFEDHVVPKAGRYRMVMTASSPSASRHEEQIWFDLPGPPVIPQQLPCCRSAH